LITHDLKLVLLLIGFLIPQSVDAQYRVGDRLVVVTPTEVRVGDRIMQMLGRGQDVRIDAIEGDLVWVKHLSTGWISRRAVRTPAEAILIFTDQINWNPFDAGAYYACGVTWTDLNEIEKAIGAFNQAIRLDPQSCGYNGRGICWARKGMTENAIADYTQAIERDPLAAVSYANRGMIWNAKGEYIKAISDAGQAIQIARGYPSAYSIRARGFAALKQFDNAVVDCEQCSLISTKGLAGYNDVAWFLATTPDLTARDGEKAVEFATKACKLNNWNDGSMLDTLAVAYAETGNFDEAVKWEMKALEIISDRERADATFRLELFKSGKRFHHEVTDLVVMSNLK